MFFYLQSVYVSNFMAEELYDIACCSHISKESPERA